MPTTTIKSVTPFFDDTPLELFPTCAYRPAITKSLRANESLCTIKPNSTPTVKPDSKITTPTTKPFRLTKAVGGKHPRAQLKRSSSTVSCSDLSDASLESSDSDSTFSGLSEHSKIPKPPGEPGRPGRGGYNLEKALNWNHGAFSKLKRLTHRLIGEHLDTTKCISAQNATSLQVVRNKALDDIPDLENYSDCWPVNDIIMMRLKYTSSRARLQELELAAGRGKKRAR